MLVLNRYEVRGALGRGGMGEVLRARDSVTGREVAIKRLLPAGAQDERRRRRFQRELEALVRLRHPGLVAVQGWGEQDGVPWIVMDLVPGRSLAQVLEERGVLPPLEAAALTSALARTLAYVHAQGLVHRDVKPDNVLLDAHGEPLLSDFGLAKDVVGQHSVLSVEGAVLGTAGYMPPEQAWGELGRVGPHSDVYGLGATLYALLTGGPPWRGDDLGELAEALQRRPEAPSARSPAVPPALDRICLRCLEPRPEARYPTADALAEDLDAFLRQPLSASPAGSSRPSRRRAPLLVAAGVLALGLVGAGWLVSRGGEPRALPVAPRPSPPPIATAGPLAQASAEPPPPAPVSAPASPAPLVTEEEVIELRRRTIALLGRPEQALAAADRLLELRPGDPDGLCNRAAALRRLGRYGEALRDLDQALARQPERAVFHLARARVLHDANRSPAEALAAYDRALLLDPELALQVLPDRAIIRDQLGDSAGALDDLDRVFQLDPSAGWQLRRRRARVRYFRGDLTGALADLDLAIAAQPDDVDTRTERGVIRRELGDLAGAREDVQAGLRLDELRAALWIDLGLIERQCAHPELAAPAFERATTLEPGSRDAWGGLAQALAELEDWARAGQAFERLVELAPELTSAWFNLAICRSRTGDRDGAVAALRRNLALLAPDDPIRVKTVTFLEQLGEPP